MARSLQARSRVRAERASATPMLSSGNPRARSDDDDEAGCGFVRGAVLVAAAVVVGTLQSPKSDDIPTLPQSQPLTVSIVHKICVATFCKRFFSELSSVPR